MLNQLFQNATLLVTLIMLYGLLTSYQKLNATLRKWLTGVLFGGIAIAAMNMPFIHEPGIIYDGRSVVLTLAGLFGGLVPGTIALVIASAFRISIGGAGVYAGVATIVFCTLTGVFFRKLYKNNPREIGTAMLLVIGVVSHIIMLLSQLLLPWPGAFKVISDIWLPVMLLFPLFFLLIAYFLKGEIIRIHTRWQLGEAQQVAGMGHYTYYVKSGDWACSNGLDDIFGIDKNYKRNNEGWKKIINQDFREEVLQYYSYKNLKYNTRFDIIYKITDQKSRSEKWVRNIGRGKFSDDEEMTEIFGTIQDITFIKESENIIRRQAQIVDQVHDSIITTGLDGNITWCNKGAEHLHGYNMDEMTGKHISLLVPMEHSQVLNEYLQNCIHEPGNCQFEIKMKKKSGGLFYASVSLSLLRDQRGGKTGIIAYVIDFTRQKQLEYKLKQSNEEYMAINEELNESLERIQQINAELEEAKEKAEESDRLKTAFLTNISHEIRTPMNGIMGFTSLLKKKDLSYKEKLSFLDIIERSSKRLLDTIEDLIDISRIESGIIRVEEHNLSIYELFEELTTLYRTEIENLGLEFIVKNTLKGEEGFVFSDKNKIYAIITNLINNAKKFTSKGFIELGCYLQNGFIHFYVKDSGKGISSKMQKAIFDRFVQEDMDLSRNYEGSGLGLSISKAFTEMMGGEIWVESQKGQGSLFTFTIPYKNSSTQTPKNVNIAGNEQQLGLQDMTILVVEDDEISYQFFENLFEGSVKKIYHARTGIEAIELFRNNSDIDLILMDIKLPKMDGFEATRKIKQLSPEIPVIAQTAFASETDRQKSIEAGCSDYIAKPVSSSLLIEKINKIFLQK
ncbi:MAG: response regulator [Bacteroidales bacterium]|nr:response regulator [Bacteroidales bacterium]